MALLVGKKLPKMSSEVNSSTTHNSLPLCTYMLHADFNKQASNEYTILPKHSINHPTTIFTASTKPTDGKMELWKE